MMILSMPPVPSASYFAPGLVSTSIDFTDEAGIDLKICDGFDENIMLGLPLTYTLNELEPITEMLS